MTAEAVPWRGASTLLAAQLPACLLAYQPRSHSRERTCGWGVYVGMCECVSVSVCASVTGGPSVCWGLLVTADDGSSTLPPLHFLHFGGPLPPFHPSPRLPFSLTLFIFTRLTAFGF